MKKFILYIGIIIITSLFISCNQDVDIIEDEDFIIVDITGSGSSMYFSTWTELLSRADYVVQCEITEQLPVTLIGGYTISDLDSIINSKNISSTPNYSLLAIRTPYKAIITDVYYSTQNLPDEILIYQPGGNYQGYKFTDSDVVSLKVNSSYILVLNKYDYGDEEFYYINSSSQGFAEIVNSNERTSELSLYSGESLNLFKDITSLEQLKDNIDTAAMALD